MKSYHIAGLIKIYGTSKEIKQLQKITPYYIAVLDDDKKFDYIFECSSLINDVNIITDIMIKNMNNDNVTDKDYLYTTKFERFTNDKDSKMIKKILDDPEKIKKFVDVMDQFMLATNLNLEEINILIYRLQTEPGLKKYFMTDKEYQEYQDYLNKINNNDYNWMLKY